MDSKPKISFSPLSDEEKMSKFRLLINSDGLCTVWKKGAEHRFNFQVNSLSLDKGEIYLSYSGKGIFEAGVYCISFNTSGVNYFTQAEIKSLSSKNSYYLTSGVVLYKTEKRASFRLLAYPTYKIKAQLHFNEEKVGESNIIDFKTKLSKTGLFKNFLKELNSENEENLDEGYLSFRVQDISATGMAIIVGRMEGSLFKKGEKLTNLVVDFEGDKIKIPTGEIVYKVDSKQVDRNNIAIYKVGVKFLNLDLRVDQLLVQKIHGVLSRLDGGKSFEDFID